MAEFEPALAVVFEHEGGHHGGYGGRDRGGATYYGISLRFLQGLGPDGDLDHDGDVDAFDIAAMTPQQAADLLYGHFWTPMGLSEVVDQGLGTKLFDLGVNMGPTQAAFLDQRAVNTYGARRVVVDGRLGPITRHAMNVSHAGRLVRGLRLLALDFYRSLVAKHPEQAIWLNGWELRAVA